MTGFVLRRLEPYTDTILRYYAAGASFEDIAVRFDCAAGTIRRFLLGNEVTLRPALRKRKLDPHRHEVMDAYVAGVDIPAIAARFRVQPQTVRNYVAEAAAR